MTFKANWEKTHSKVHLPGELMRKMLGTYYVHENEIKSISIIEGGCANINVLVHFNSSSKDPVILRIYLRDNKSAYIEQKVSTLLCGELPVPRFYHIAEAFGYVFAIMEYLPGATLRDLLLSDQQIDIKKVMFKVGEVLGIISSSNFSNSGFFNKNLEIKESLSRESLVDFCEGVLTDGKVKAIIPVTQREQITTLFNTYKRLLPDGTEKNLVHADFDPANILVTKNNDEIDITGIIDWEFSFSGSSLWDVANMLRYAYQMPKAYQDSFLKGLSSTGHQLPDSWQITVNLLNIMSLLDCLKRSDVNSRPNQTKDIKMLISHILYDLKK
ncbi:phosphotransferase family protein [Facilibium subflavum]|uniref:phosphotransferase family protein n=1 Tax=Facilibium subflavum TaxID=2219058 RepID=UPI000E65537B|nr:aminoglycoside phosphotransferase family protein [Facilibium subflavum]